jgi:hypothetical protein
MTSTVEKVVSDLIALFQTITVANGYRNTVAKVLDVMLPEEKVSSADTPVISVLVESGRTASPNTNLSTFETEFGISAIGYVSASQNLDGTSNLFSAAESLIHDMKRAIASFALSHLNDATKRYQVLINEQNPLIEDRVMDVSGRHGIVGLGFMVKIFAQDSTFAN